MQFATCERGRALEFIRSVYPNRTVEDEGPVAGLLDLVEADKLRITDPSMHGTAQVVTGTHDIDPTVARAAAKAMHDYLTGEATDGRTEEPGDGDDNAGD